MGDIIDTFNSAGTFKRFVSAVQAADLIDTLRDGFFTVFAPDDQAFANLPPDTEDLLKDMPKLTAVLMYHMVAGKLTIDKISKIDSAKTLQGQEIKINARKWHLHVPPKINDAFITNTDIVADNGVIHVLDRVLMPDMALTCMTCGMGFMTVEALNTHTEKIHMTEKIPLPMPAETMPIIEKAKEPMPTTHEVPLRGVEPNQVLCPVCGKPFKTRQEMERHMDASHHESKGHE